MVIKKRFRKFHTFSLECYHKYYDREYPFVNPDREDYFEPSISNPNKDHLKAPDGVKKVYGLELLLQKKKYDAFYYSLAYSLSSVRNKYTNGNYYADENDFRTAFSCVLGSNFFKNHGLSIRFNAMLGRPYSKQIVVDVEGEKVAIFDPSSDYFSERFDPIFLLSARYSFKRYKKRSNFTGYIEVINILNQEPKVSKELDEFSGKWEYTTMNGIVPIMGLTWDF